MAAQHDVDLSSVTGTGVGGRIRKQDVLDAAKAQGGSRRGRRGAGRVAAATPAAVDERRRRCAARPSRCRACARSSPKRMVESLQTCAQLTRWSRSTSPRSRGCATRSRPTSSAREGVKLSFLPFFAKAAIDALKQHPSLNADDRHREGRGHLLRHGEPRDRGRHREAAC